MAQQKEIISTINSLIETLKDGQEVRVIQTPSDKGTASIAAK